MSKQTASSGIESTKLVIVAIVIALVAVVLVNVYIESVRASAQEETFTVYRLKHSVRPDEVISRKDLREVTIPKRFESAFETSLKPNDLISKADRVPIRRHASAGDFLTFNLFSRPEQSEFDRRIKEGKRLISIPVNPRTLPGNVRPGMYIDIEAPFGGGRMPDVLPVLERVQVMAVGRHTVVEEAGAGPSSQVGSYRSITIEVEPDEATQIAEIQRMATGDFEIHLRNPSDRDSPKIEGGGINPVVLEMLEQRTGRSN